MKLKAAIRYQAVELVQSAAVFCLIIGAIIAAVALIGLTKGAYLSVPNMGFLPYFLMPLLALSTFQGDIRFLMQMGLTRPQVIASTGCVVGGGLPVPRSRRSRVRDPRVVLAADAVVVLDVVRAQQRSCARLLFMALGCAATSGRGLAFAALQMRFGTRRVVLACAALVLVGLTILTNVEGAAWAFAWNHVLAARLRRRGELGEPVSPVRCRDGPRRARCLGCCPPHRGSLNLRGVSREPFPRPRPRVVNGGWRVVDGRRLRLRRSLRVAYHERG